MTDVLTVALERQRELRDEIAEIDEFIRLAETLLRNAKASAGERSQPRQERAETKTAQAKAAEPAAATAQAETDEEPEDSAETDEAASSESDAGVRRFPWTGMQPAVRRTGSGSDETTGPTRRNVFRRDMTAAG